VAPQPPLDTGPPRHAVEDVVEKHNVPPEIWQNKTVEGPDPYPVNGGSAWAVREYEWLDDVEEPA